MADGKAELILSKSAGAEFALYTPIQKIEHQGDGSLLVSGWGSVSDYIDEQGDFPDPAALTAATADWGTHWGNIREQHDASKAIGSARPEDYPGAEISIKKHPETDTDALWLTSHIVDSEAIKKVKAGVLKGYSIGGMIMPGGRVMSELNGQKAYCLKDFTINEVSLVDKPACNLAAVEHVQLAKRSVVAVENLMPEQDQIDKAVDDMPVEHRGSVLKFVGRLLGKANGILTASSAPAEEKKVEVSITKVKKAADPIRIQKNLYTVGQLAQLVQELDYLVDGQEWEAESEGDASPIPGRLAAARDELGQILVAMVEEEVAEIADGTEEEGEVAMALSQKASELLASIKAAPKADEAIEKAGKKLSGEMMGHLNKAMGHLDKAQKAHGEIEKMHKAADYSGLDDKLGEMEGHHDSAEKCLKAMKAAGDGDAEDVKDGGADEDQESKKASGSEFAKQISGVVAELKSQREAIEKSAADLKAVNDENSALKLEKAKLEGKLEVIGKMPAQPKARLTPVYQGDAARELGKAAGGQGEEEQEPTTAKGAIAATLRKGGRVVAYDPTFKGSMTAA